MDYPLLYRVLRPRSSHIRPAFSARANEPWGEGVPAPLLLVGRTLRGETVWRFGMQAEPGFAGRAQALLSSGAWDPDAVPDALGLRRCVHEVCL